MKITKEDIGRKVSFGHSVVPNYDIQVGLVHSVSGGFVAIESESGKYYIVNDNGKYNLSDDMECVRFIQS